MVVVDMWAGSYVGNLIENSVDSGGNWVDETEQGIGVEIVALVAQDQTENPCEIWMVPPSRVVCFGVWIVVGFGICCIHIFREHLSLINRILLKQVGESMTVGTTRIDHWCWVDLIHRIGFPSL